MTTVTEPKMDAPKGLQVDASGFMPIGEIAGKNIANLIGQPERHAEITRAIKDEIYAMSTHFTMAVSDLEFATQAELLKIRSTFTFIKQRPVLATVLSTVIFVTGALLGYLVR